MNNISRIVVILISFYSLVNCTDNQSAKPKPLNPDTKLATLDSLNTELDKLFRQRKYSKAIQLFNQALILYDELDSLEGRSKALSNIGLCYYSLGNYDSSEYYYHRSMTVDSMFKNKPAIPTLKNLGILYKKRGEFYKTIDFYQKALKIAGEENNLGELASINYSIGNLLNKQDKFREAIDYHLNALDSWSGLADTARIAKVLNNLGNDYSGLQSYDTAIYYYHQSLLLKRKEDNRDEIASTLNNFGEIFLKLADYDSARFYLQNAYQFKKELNNARSLGLTANNLAKLYLATDDEKRSKHYLDTAMLVIKKENIRDLLAENYDLKSQWFETRGQLDSALHYYQAWNVLQDSLFQVEKLQVVEELASIEKEEIDLQKKAAESIALQRLKLADSRLNIIWIIIAGVVILLVFLIYVFIQRNKIKKLNRELGVLNDDIIHRKQNQYSLIIRELDRFGPESHLDPIKNMLLASSSVDDKLYKEKETKVVTLDIYMEKLLKDLKESLGLDARPVEIIPSIAAIRIPENKAIKISFLISELITNSVKHANYEAELKLRIDINQINEMVKVEYRDNGTKINKKLLVESKGMGWRLVDSFAETLKTKVEVDFEDGWNVFSFDFKI